MTFKMTGEDQTITVYNLRADTQEYIGKGDAFIPAFTGLPANCTTVTPPEIKAGFIAIFEAEKQKWALNEDHRGETVFNTETGAALLITEPGAYPDRTTLQPPENAWQKWDGTTWVNDEAAEHAALIEQAEASKKTLIKQVGEVIATLQDAVDFEMATAEEKQRLIDYKKYRVLLSRVQTENAPDIVWPEAPENVA